MRDRSERFYSILRTFISKPPAKVSFKIMLTRKRSCIFFNNPLLSNQAENSKLDRIDSSRDRTDFKTSQSFGTAFLYKLILHIAAFWSETAVGDDPTNVLFIQMKTGPGFAYDIGSIKQSHLPDLRSLSHPG